MGSSRRVSTRSHSSRDETGRPKTVDIKAESSVKLAPFIAGDEAMVKETAEIISKTPPAPETNIESVAPTLEPAERSIPPPEESKEKVKDRSHRSKHEDREKRSSRQHKSSSEKDKEREKEKDKEKEKEREARRARREEERRLVAARLKVEEDARIAKEQEEADRAIRRAERRKRRAEEERLRVEEEEAERQKEETEKAADDSPEPAPRKSATERGVRVRRRDRGDSLKESGKERRDVDRPAEATKERLERGERVHRSSTRRQLEVEKQRDKERSKGAFSSLWSSAKKAFT
jgi:hypothetical protein